MTYVPPAFKEKDMTTQQKVDALNLLESQAADGLIYIDAFLHDDHYYTKTIEDATFYRRPVHPLGRNDGPGSLLNAISVDGYTKPQLQALAIPSGAFCLWAKSVASIPSQFLHMNGQNETIDTRGRVLMCSGGDYQPGTLDGSPTVSPYAPTFDPDIVVLTTNQIPRHQHTYTDKYNPVGNATATTYVDNTVWTETTTGINEQPNANPVAHGHPGSTMTIMGYYDETDTYHSGSLPLVPKSKAYAWILRK